MPQISVAPMMDWTDRHDRYFLRLIAPNVKLYTEMIAAEALKHGKYHLLDFNAAEKPLGLQLGGSNPQLLAYCAKLGEEYNYDEINLNVGCPSPRVKKGRFGACLMLEPELVSDCIQSMQEAVKIPVTVKCRIGVDNTDSYEALQQFIAQIARTGCDTFIIHARKAWLNGLSPKQNREIPPLNYAAVWQIKKDFPTLNIIVNGGIKTLDEIDQQLLHVDGVMIGREAYKNPYFLAEIQEKYFTTSIKTRAEIIAALLPYVKEQLSLRTRLASITRHILGLYYGQRGGRAWRSHLSKEAQVNNADIDVIQQALTFVK